MQALALPNHRCDWDAITIGRPYSALDEKGRPTGVLIGILGEALNRRMGIPVEAVSLPWARAQVYIRNRKVDGLITVPTEERLQYLVASKNVFSIFLNVYINRASPNYEALASVTDVADLAPFEACEINGNQSAIHGISVSISKK